MFCVCREQTSHNWDHDATLQVASPAQYACDVWHFVAVTISGTAGNLYVDGISPGKTIPSSRDLHTFSISSFNTTLRPDNSMDNANAGVFKMGHYPEEGFVGSLDEVRGILILIISFTIGLPVAQWFRYMLQLCTICSVLPAFTSVSIVLQKYNPKNLITVFLYRKCDFLHGVSIRAKSRSVKWVIG